MIKAAIYGLGRWGERLIESVQDSAKIRFVRGISRDPVKHEALAQRAGLRVVSSWSRVLRDREIDAVVIATPHSQHVKQIIQAARAGKHVFVEKPMTLTRRSAERAVEACRSAGVTLGVGFNRRYAPSFVEMRRRIAAGEIGDLLHLEGAHSGPTGFGLKPGHWRSSREEAPAGGMTARGIHALDAMIGLAGPVASVYAFSENRRLPEGVDMDDTTSMLLRFAGGVTGYLSTLFTTGDLYRVHAFGTQGWLELRGDAELYRRGLQGPVERIPLEAVDKERAELEAFADAVAARQPFTVPPEEAVNGVAVLQAIVASAKKGRPVLIR